MKQSFLLDYALVVLATLEAASGHAVNTGPSHVEKAVAATGIGSQLRARNHPVSSLSNPTEPPCATVTTAPLQWIRRQLLLGTVTSASSHVSPPSSTSVHLPKLPGQSFSYTNSSKPATSPAAGSTGSYITSSGRLYSHSSVLLRTGGHNVTTSTKDASATTITLPIILTTSSTVVCPSAVAASVAHVASISGFSAAQSVAASAMSTLRATASIVSQLSDGQIQAPASKGVSVSQISVGQFQAPGNTTIHAATPKSSIQPTVSQISDGQVQVPPASNGVVISQSTKGVPASISTAGNVASQISDGQVQAPPTSNGVVISQSTKGVPASISTAGNVASQISDGQVQVPSSGPTLAPAGQISDGQIQVPTSQPVSQISDDQVQEATLESPAPTPISQISDGQVQVPTSQPVSQISDGQVQAATLESPAPTPISQISDDQVQVQTSQPVSQISDDQVQAATLESPAPTPISQISDGQVQAPTIAAPAALETPVASPAPIQTVTEPAPPPQVYTETQTSYPYVPPSPSSSSSSSSTLTDTTAPTVPPGTVVERPQKGEAAGRFESKTSGSSLALVMVIVVAMFI
ncbi:MAG: hypothetical protein Q9172_001436 [Xanthocarpia lactea]